MDSIIKHIVQANEANGKINEGDYYDENGRLFCGKCREPKQTEQPIRINGKAKRMFIPCRCEREEEERYKQRIAMQQFNDRVQKFRKMGLTDKAYESNTFSNDDMRNPDLTSVCKRYVDHWKEMSADSCGILFYGNTGGGKSFYACCIANALLNNGVRVIVTRLSDLVRNRNDKTTPDINLKQFELIVLDDIGVENATQTAYNIIDDIYRAAIPLIVTTNLAPSELKAPESLDRQRIYDRIIERCCLTYKVDAVKSRLETARENRKKALNILNANE